MNGYHPSHLKHPQRIETNRDMIGAFERIISSLIFPELVQNRTSSGNIYYEDNSEYCFEYIEMQCYSNPTMPFVGNQLSFCHLSFFSNHDFHLVIVSGTTGNLCGHALLNIGGKKGYYVHVDGARAYPKYMTHFDYNRYLLENGKTELWRQRLTVTKPTEALLKIEKLLSEKWFWGGLIHNCASFVEEIVNAGGANLNIKSNCPTNFIPVRYYD